MTTNQTLADIFNDEYRTCIGSHNHTKAEGAETTRTAFYPAEM